MKSKTKSTIEKPNYGGPGFHIFINLVLGIILAFFAALGAVFLHILLLLLVFPAVYFIFSALKWKEGSAIEERLRIREELIKFVQPKDGDRILDVGTGGGLLAIGFAKAVNTSEVVGIDIWMRLGGGTSLETAKRNAKIEDVADKVKFEEGDARDIPYSDDYFDIIVASFAIHIINKDRKKALQEMIRVLRPGGKFAIIEPAQGYRWKVDEKLRETLEVIGLENVKFRPLLVSYPRKRYVYIIYGEKKSNGIRKRKMSFTTSPNSGIYGFVSLGPNPALIFEV